MRSLIRSNIIETVKCNWLAKVSAIQSASSQSYFLLSIAGVLLVLMFFQLKKLPNLD